MALVYEHVDWQQYTMQYDDPFRPVEPLEREITAVAGALAALRAAGILTHTEYDLDKMLAHRAAVADLFEIPWTAIITLRMQRLLYAINAIAQPRHMLAAGVFCGNTFISNAGAAVGPGACYTAEELLGIEIKPEEAERAERNVRRIDASGVAHVVAADAVAVAARYPHPIDLFYLDATGEGSRGKGIYLDILEASEPHLRPGTIILAHNSINSAEGLSHYLAYVRDPRHCRASVNVMIDGEGLEVSVK
jgi:predicted O-methyltransferase YrrM